MDAIAQIRESAARLGVELDESDASQWLAAMAAEAEGGDLVVDVESGTYGHRITMLDFKPTDLARFRRIGRIVGLEDRPGTVATALALSGSAAQSKIQSFPGDCDYFERVHIHAATRAEATAILADVIREKALATRVGPTHRLCEVKFGSYPFDATRAGKPVRAGTPISWTPQEVVDGRVEVTRGDGSAETLTWEQVSADPGWCKLDWVVADAERGRLANASNMLDVTWEAPDGTIVPLDGFIDPYYQEVYLEAESMPVFSRLVKQLSGDAVDEYLEQLEGEVRKYTSPGHENFGKAARRMYNIFRLTGRYQEAAFIRELFDEPVTVLYQVAALIRTLDDAARPGGEFTADALVAQTDALIMSAIAALDGEAESQIVGHLLRVRDSMANAGASVDRAADVEGVRGAAMKAVNDYFQAKLSALPSVREYLDGLSA